MRLIDADALDRCWGIPNGVDRDSYDKGASMVFNMIEAAPTVDAVPVVRCKDCKHKPVVPQWCENGFDIEFSDDICPCQCDDGWYSWCPDDNWFCPRGNRKGGMNDATD